MYKYANLPISASRLEMESARPLPLARLQNVPPPPAGAISQGLARAGGAPVLAHKPLVGTDPYAMSDQERSKYESFFPMYDSDRDGFVTGGEAVELFSKSRLPREVSFLFICRRKKYGRSVGFSLSEAVARDGISCCYVLFTPNVWPVARFSFPCDRTLDAWQNIKQRV